MEDWIRPHNQTGDRTYMYLMVWYCVTVLSYLQKWPVWELGTGVRISFHSLYKIHMSLYPGVLTYISKSLKGMLLPMHAFVFLIMCFL